VGEVVGLLQSCVLVFLSVLIVRSTGSTHPEGSTVWQSDRNVCKDSQHTVGQWRPEGQIVGDLMNSEEQVLVRRSSNHVCRSQEAPVKDRGIAEEVRAGQLDRHNEENNPFCQGLRAAELGDLKVKIGVSNAVQERWQGTREPSCYLRIRWLDDSRARCDRCSHGPGRYRRTSGWALIIA
jgi:hypothetical protein